MARRLSKSRRRARRRSRTRGREGPRRLSRRQRRRRLGRRVTATCLLLAVALTIRGGPGPAAITTPEVPPAGVPRVEVELGGARFLLEVADDQESRHVGLSGRQHLPPRGGMLFVYPTPQPLSFVMRDCPNPLDLAFLGPEGEVLGVEHMEPEAPRGPDETAEQYEARLPRYDSPGPAQFAIEIAGGRLRDLGVGAGDRARFEHEALVRIASP